MVTRTRKPKWGGHRSNQSGRPRKWPEGTVRRPVAVPPDVAKAVAFVQAAHEGMSWNDAVLVLVRHGAASIEGAHADIARAILERAVKRQAS